MKTIFETETPPEETLSEPYLLVGMINSFNNLFQSKADAFFQDISWKQIYILASILLFEKAPTIRDLSNLTGSTHQNVSQILLKLEKKKLIFFQNDETDKRKQRIFLTEKGLKFCRSYDQPVDQKMKQLFSSIDPEELHTTIRVIRSLNENAKDL